MNKQAEELNRIIRENNPVIYDLLSEKGRAIFSPKEGILTQSAEAKGKKINATIGISTEDDGTPMRLTPIAEKIILDPKDAFPYAPSEGKLELREAWKNEIKKKNPSLKNRISLPVVTNALTHGLNIAGYLFVNPGDRVILTDKQWDNYGLIFENNYGATLENFNTFHKNGFDTESLNKKLLEIKGKQVIVINFPNNPTGYTPTNEEAEEIIKIIKKSAGRGNEIVVMCDDAYFGLIYKKGIYSESLFSKLADLHENVLAIKLDGATKEYYVWGFRVGFITYSSKGITEQTCRSLEAKSSGAIRSSISNTSNLTQSLVFAALKSPLSEIEKKEKYEILKKRFERVQEVLKDNKFSEFFSALPYNSGYFMCVELKPGLDAEKVRQTLLKKYDTGVITMKNLLRIAYSSVAEKDIKQLFENIYNACKEQHS
jgi:aspartate/methionine/tyrosine aminotransferase